MRSVSSLVISKTYEKEIEGVCALCGPTLSPAFYPLEEVVSDNFVYYNKVRGNKLCQRCVEMWRDDRFRRSSFLATSNGVMFIKPKEAVQFLLSPTYPFVIYLTKTYKKQGWLEGFRNISVSSNIFYIHTDFVGCVQTTWEEVKSLLTAVEKVISNKIPKTRLVSMDVNTYKKILEFGLEEEYKLIREYTNTPVLEVVMYVT
ncbi:MAG: hypothetical protein ABDH28_01890 [Brevinematia bacterium]